jgi:hypothetical protein
LLLIELLVDGTDRLERIRRQQRSCLKDSRKVKGSQRVADAVWSFQTSGPT